MNQYEAVKTLLLDGEWRTCHEVADITGMSKMSAGCQIRRLGNKENGLPLQKRQIHVIVRGRPVPFTEYRLDLSKLHPIQGDVLDRRPEPSTALASA